MSSVAHSRIRTIDQSCLKKAADDLGITCTEQDESISVGNGTRFKFDSKGNVEVSYWDDIKSSAKTARQLAQLSTYYTMVNRMNAIGMKQTKAVQDVVAAVRANQKLVVEFEESEVGVNA